MGFRPHANVFACTTFTVKFEMDSREVESGGDGSRQGRSLPTASTVRTRSAYFCVGGTRRGKRKISNVFVSAAPFRITVIFTCVPALPRIISATAFIKFRPATFLPSTLTILSPLSNPAFFAGPLSITWSTRMYSLITIVSVARTSSGETTAPIPHKNPFGG